MTVKRLHESQLQEFDGELPNLPLLYFKLVNVGPKHLADNEYKAKRICDLVNRQLGCFLVGENLEDLRDSMHQLIEQFYEALKGIQDESKSQQSE